MVFLKRSRKQVSEEAVGISAATELPLDIWRVIIEKVDEDDLYALRETCRWYDQFPIVFLLQTEH
jgi:F-box domain